MGGGGKKCFEVGFERTQRVFLSEGEGEVIPGRGAEEYTCITADKTFLCLFVENVYLATTVVHISFTNPCSDVRNMDRGEIWVGDGRVQARG